MKVRDIEDTAGQRGGMKPGAPVAVISKDHFDCPMSRRNGLIELDMVKLAGFQAYDYNE